MEVNLSADVQTRTDEQQHLPYMQPDSCRRTYFQCHHKNLISVINLYE